jgi:polysaccharide biosynthesis transport protein
MTGPVTEKGTAWPVPPTSGPTRDVITLDPARVMRALLRQWRLIAIAAGAGGFLALLLGLGTVARYESTVTVLLDEERSELLTQVSALPNAVVTDSAIQSEMEIIRSRALALAVVDTLRLDQDEAFLNPPVDATVKAVNAVRGLLRPLLGGSTPAAVTGPDGEVDPAVAAREAAASLLLSQIVVERVERSYVMRVTYVGFDPHKAALVARTYGEEYTRFQLAGTTEVASNAGKWIRERLDLMERRNIEAASDVQRFRLDNNLLQARGDLLTEQQQSEIATALVTAATQTAALRAELESYESLLSASAGEMAAVGAMQSEVDSANPLVDLRREYIETRRNLGRVAAQAGEDHPQAQRLRTALESLESEIALALEGTVASVRTRYNIARSREESLRQELAAITETSRGNETVTGRLAQLEAIAQTYATVYADYLLRYETTAQQQGFPIASAQIISDAEVPLSPSGPRRLRMLAAGLFLGGLIGLMLAALREMRAGPLRTAGEVTSQSGLPCAGLVPRSDVVERDENAARVALRTANRVRQEIDRKAPLARGRIVGLAALDNGGDVAGVVAALSRAMIARAGTVKIVDAGGLTEAARADLRSSGHLEIASLSDLREALYENDTRRTNKDALSVWRDEWAYTLIVMQPLTEMVLADHLTGVLDATVLMIEWGKITPTLLTDAMRDHRDFRANLAATVLDSADLPAARRYLDPAEYEAKLIHA